MRDPRNPFRLRRSESIETDATFLSLFEPGILDIMPTDRWKEGVHILRSAAGGGKTSLIRLFVPAVLHTLFSRRSEEQLRELFQKVIELGAIDEAGPNLLGVMLLCGRSYSRLQDLLLEPSRKDRLFFGLLNARIALAVLHNVVAYKQLKFPDDLGRIRIHVQDESFRAPGLSLPCDGSALFHWARELEDRVCRSLDSFGPLQVDILPGHDSLLSLSLIRADAITIDGKPVADRVLLMMDDIQQLTSHQRGLLIETVIESRSPVGVWIAERFEALNTREMLASGTNEGRDYNQPVELETYWKSRSTKFEKLTIRIADRRVRYAGDTDLESFRACMQESLDGASYDSSFNRACDDIRSRIQSRIGKGRRFEDWIAAREQAEGTPRERAVGWRALEILIEREMRKAQRSLFDDEALDEGQLKQKDDSSVKQAAELFLAREYRLPYYFGSERISRLASLNIKQFLGLSGDLFEESVSSELLRKSPSLSPDRQHKLMKRAAQTVWDDIPNGVARVGSFATSLTRSVGSAAGIPIGRRPPTIRV